MNFTIQTLNISAFSNQVFITCDDWACLHNCQAKALFRAFRGLGVIRWDYSVGLADTLVLTFAHYKPAQNSYQVSRILAEHFQDARVRLQITPIRVSDRLG